MELNDYQKAALKTAIYPKNQQVIYPVLGLCGESGEVAEKLKKIYRDKNSVIDESDRLAIAKELGDVLWYLSVLANDLGMDLEEIAQMNIDKLNMRKKKNMIGGSGDDREQK